MSQAKPGCNRLTAYDIRISTNYLGVSERVVKSVSRKESGLAVDVVQRYLDSRQSSYALVRPSEREGESEKERRTAISLVQWRVDLEVGPLAG